MTRHTRDKDQGALLPLPGKVSRIIESLTRSTFTSVNAEPGQLADIALDVSEDAVTRVIEAWRSRASYLPGKLLADPAWGMLLELLQAEVQDRRVSLSRLCTVSEVSESSAVRWLKALERQGLVVRRANPEDADNEFVELSPKGRSALRRYFHDVVQSR